MKLPLKDGHEAKFIKLCMVGDRVCSMKEPCPKVAKYNFKYENGYVMQ